MYLKGRLVLIIFSLFCLFPFEGCQNQGNNSPSKLSISMIDSPGDYQAVNIEIDSVEIKIKDGNWTSLNDFKPGIYNLLDYTAGHELSVSSREMPSAVLTEVRVLLGNQNTIKVDGQEFKLTTPGGVDPGVIVPVNQMLDPGQNIQMVIDFDASSSIREASGIFLLRPVIRVYNKSTTGSISGKVYPDSLNVSIQVYSNGIIASTYAPKGMSDFIVSGLPAGTYELIFDPGTQSGFQQYTTNNNLSVAAGKTTDVGNVYLPKQ